jgi:hypothetical protein
LCCKTQSFLSSDQIFVRQHKLCLNFCWMIQNLFGQHRFRSDNTNFVFRVNRTLAAEFQSPVL